MLFKFVTVAAAFASIVSGSAVNLEARQQGGLATCQIRTTPSNTPNGGSLSEEFILSKYMSSPFFKSILIYPITN